jgi:hypothetical protein
MLRHDDGSLLRDGGCVHLSLIIGNRGVIASADEKRSFIASAGIASAGRRFPVLLNTSVALRLENLTTSLIEQNMHEERCLWRS